MLSALLMREEAPRHLGSGRKALLTACEVFLAALERLELSSALREKVRCELHGAERSSSPVVLAGNGTEGALTGVFAIMRCKVRSDALALLVGPLSAQDGKGVRE